MDAINYFAQSSMKQNAPELRAGDTVRVHQKIREGNKERIQIFEGVVMSVRGRKAINSSFVVRRVASGVGVEKTFPLHSPNVVKVERVKSSQVRQARLYYLRDRFGRNARMKGETWSKDVWEEPTASAEALEVEPEVAEEAVEAEEPTEVMPADQVEEVTTDAGEADAAEAETAEPSDTETTDAPAE